MIKVKKAQNLWESTFGMLLPKFKDGILLKTRFGIHTFLMRFPIDVYILNDKCQIMNYKLNLKPNRLYFWNPRFENVLELPTKNNKLKFAKKPEKIKYLVVE